MKYPDAYCQPAYPPDAPGRRGACGDGEVPMTDNGCNGGWYN